MTKILPAVFCSVVICFLTACVSSEPKITERSFKPLFDGQTLKGWKAVDKKGSGYVVENGVLVCPDKGGGDLFTEREYSDFILRLDFKIARGGNNGVAIRSPAEPGQIAYIGNEIQVIDDAGYKDLKPGQNCGSLYRVFPAISGAARPAGEWNSYEITARGRFVKVVLNGQTVVSGNLNDVTDPDVLWRHTGMFRSKGHIGFLGHGSRAEFRNIRIYEFPKYYPTDNVAPEGFVRLFNGRDLSGWRGLVADPVKRKTMSLDEWAKEQIKADNLMQQNWKVEKGTVVYRGRAFDNLCTEKQFGDFEMLVDWKVEPKADSGIYLRGCPQVQIWESNSGGFDKKHPGSGGLFNNKKGPNYPSRFADHYIGEWNRFRIVMVGEKVHVFLNDELVVDNKTLENYWEREKPVYALGPIELQAHQSVVHFKNIYIREILPTSVNPSSK
jgi:hypothetical protein